MTSQRSPLRWDAATSRCSRPPSAAAMAISNFSSARAVVERLQIERVGHFGDGVADAAGHHVYVPYTLEGETVDVEAVPGHPDRRRLLAVEHPSHNGYPPSARISAYAGAARSSTGKPKATAHGSGVWLSRSWRKPGL